jgi:phenylpropionate dioxygenase-like ring-hydroxylating dioxygenase large terminal subunit
MVAGFAGSAPGRTKAPRNAWYVVAFSDEIAEKPLARTILGDRVVMYRTSSGKPVVLADRCAHRAMALSQGKVVHGDRIQCPYHGMEYDPAGACVLVPSQVQIPRQMRTHSYPSAERWRWVWAWMGDPAAADESLIPDHRLFGLADDDGFHKVVRFRMHINGNYQFLHENLLDVSHISFLHEGFLDSGLIAKTPPKTEVQGDRIIISRRVTEVVSGGYARVFGLEPGTRVERELRSEVWSPNFNVVTNYFSFPDDPVRPTACRHAPFAITPETDTSCHYFVASASNYGEAQQGDALAQANKLIWDVFLSDKEAIESVQRSYLDLGERTPDVSVRADEAAVRFRRVLEQQLLREAPAVPDSAGRLQVTVAG